MKIAISASLAAKRDVNIKSSHNIFSQCIVELLNILIFATSLNDSWYMKFLHFNFLKNHYLSILFGVFILFISLIPFQNVPGHSLFNLPHMDKIVHFILYGMFSFVILFESLWRKTFTRKMYMFAVLACLIFGGIIELLQIIEPHRSGEWYDLLANLLGSISAILPFILLKDFLSVIFDRIRKP